MCIAQSIRRRARSQVIHGLVGQAGNLDIEQCHIDMLASTIMIAMGEGGQNCHSRIQPGKNVGQRYSYLYRTRTLLTLRKAGKAHQAAKPLDHEVVPSTLGIRASLAKAGNRAINQLWVDDPQAFIIQPISGQTTHFEVLDDHIRFCRKFTH
ncbi:hypothetical protein D3C77_559690 [compost metagenome]